MEIVSHIVQQKPEGALFAKTDKVGTGKILIKHRTINTTLTHTL